MNPWMKVIALIVVFGAGYGAGHHVAAVSGEAALATKQSAWDTEKADIANQRAAAVTAQRLAEQKQADAISAASKSYEKGKADAEAANADVVAGLRDGTLRLRDQWATCRATSAAVSSASGGRQPDEGTDDREASAGRIVRAAAQCDAQVTGLQQALMGEREGQ